MNRKDLCTPFLMEDNDMAFENVDLFDAVANASLEKYGWQDRCEAKLIVLSENATYMVKNKRNR